MDPASIFIILVVGVVALGIGVFLYLTSAGLELRESGRRRRRQRRPQHTRVENEQHAVSSPVRAPVADASKPPRASS